MTIKINDIPPEGLALELEQTLNLFKEGAAETSFTAVLHLKPAGRGIVQITGRVRSQPQLECSRCLKSFSYPIDSEFSIEVSPISSMTAVPEHELSGSELETEFYQGDEIDPLEFVREQLLISIPMVPVHSPDCKGLCQNCGTDLNLGNCGCKEEGLEKAGPFSGLKDLFKK